MDQLRRIEGADPLYQLEGKLGQGGFGTVYKAKRKRDGLVVAKKIITVKLSSRDKESSIKVIEAEVRALQRLGQCRHVVKWSPDIAWDTVGSKFHLHMQYYSMGDLHGAIKRMRKASKRFDELQVLEIFRDMVIALTDCHAKGIFHRDIKPANILLGPVPASGAKYPNGSRIAAFLTDFGVGKFTIGAVLQKNVNASCLAGTDRYIPPEVLKGIVGPESDIFSLGCAMFEVCELRPAFAGRFKASTPRMSAPYQHLTKDAILSSMKLAHQERPKMAVLSKSLDKLVSAARNPPSQPLRIAVPAAAHIKQPKKIAPVPFKKAKHAPVVRIRAVPPAPQARVQAIRAPQSDHHNCSICLGAGCAATLGCCYLCCTIM